MSTQLSGASRAVVIAYNMGYRVGENGTLYNPQGAPRKSRLGSAGYPRINITSRCRYTFYLHRLMAYQKFGEKIFEKGMEVRHLNGVKTDNSYDNIAIGTRSQNQMDIPPYLRPRTPSKLSAEDKSKQIKVNTLNSDLKPIRDMYASGKFSQDQVAAKYNISQKTVYRILTYLNCVGK